MKKLALMVCLAGALVGCVKSGEDGMLPPPGGEGSGSDTEELPALDVSHASPCEGTTVLQGVDVPASFTVPSRSYDTAGALFCFEIDARQNLRIAHFAAGTAYQQADVSSFRIALLDANSAMLLEGWDVAFGSTDPSAFANLEYGVTAGDYVAVKLFVSSKVDTATTEVSASVFEPFE
jgi:hypothetical protein